MSFKDSLLLFFTNHPDEVFSGEDLAERFNVTRAAIWKSIKTLKANGYHIDAAGGKGYLFSSKNDFLDPLLIKQGAQDSSFPLYVLDTIDSTNTYAKRLVVEGAVHGTYIVANAQTIGRGRAGHSFYSPANSGIYISYILKPEKPIEHLLRLTVAAAVATCEAISSNSSESPQIKWVNDIYVNNKKAAGILTEASSDFETRRVDSVIIGIGINCHTEFFPEEIQSIAGNISNEEVSRNKLAGELYNRLQYWTNHLDDPELMKIYREKSLLIGKSISYIENEKEYHAQVLDINSEGNLVIQDESGLQKCLSSGEVHVCSWK